MKRTLAALMAIALAVSLTACANQQNNSSKQETSSSASVTTASQETSAPAAESKTDVNEESKPGGNEIQPNPVELLFHPATSAATGAYATIKLSADVKMDDSSAWLGLCPAGKDYITELEADEVDVIWFNADARENETDPYVFSCDFSDVADGTYAVVVATSDDENVGYVAIQLEMTKAGEKLTFDYSNAKLKERPKN